MQLIQKKFINHPAISKRALLTLILIIIWSFFLWRALDAFAPSGGYSSDSAIPVLMSNDDRPITIFNLYYYGTDRWGGWPFLVAQGIRRSIGYRWSDQSLYVMQAIWVFIGVLAIALLSRRDLLPVAVIYLVALCLHGEARYQIFVLSQVYAWQITALALSWFSLRRLFDNHLESSKEKRKEKHAGWKRNMWRFLVLWFSFLAIWSSIASAPTLFFLLGLEALRAHLKREKEAGDVSRRRRSLRLALEGFVLISAATLLELLQKWNFHRHGVKHYNYDFKTHFELDTGNLIKNTGIHLQSIAKLSWWPLYLLSALAVLALLSVLVYSLLKKRRELLERLKTIFVDDTVIIIVGGFGISLISFVLAVSVSHVRLNDYDDRFLTLANLFGPISGLLTIYLAFRLVAESSQKPSEINAYARHAFVLTCLLLLIFKFPVRGHIPYYKLLNDTALALSEKAPGGILMGGYWETYVFTSLQPVNAMTAVPIEGHENRMPWTREMVRRADQVVVEYRHTKLGGATSPPERLNQYGSSFRLIDPKWYENGEYAFALYVNETKN